MKLTQEDAYAFRRIMAKMDIPEDLALSPLARLLINTLDPVNKEEGWQTLYAMLTSEAKLTQQILYVDPQVPLQHPQDDHAYIENYIQQVTTQTNAPKPDTNRTNGSTDWLIKLYKMNRQGGPKAAQQLVGQHRSLTYEFDEILNEAPIEYLDNERIIQSKEITAIVGQPGAGKSFWAIHKLVELADEMPVLYIAAEGINPERLRAVVKMRQTEGIKHTRTFSQNFRICKTPLDLTRDASLEHLLADLGDFKPQLIVIDTFAACTPGIDENSSKDVQPVLNRIRRMLIECLGCAILLIHHTTKDGKSFRGSSALRGNVANMYYLLQNDDLITLRSDKQRDNEASQDRHYRLVKFETRRHPVTNEQLSSVAMLPAEKVVIDSNHTKLASKALLILNTLADFENGLTTGSLQEATQLSKATMWRYIQKLIKLNFIKTGEKGEPIYITVSGREMIKQA